ncbi:MAG TPA: ATP-binding protein [Terriglobales bacterium]|nr:ATP-binding protein [Terriglobales bacterium]
MGKMATHLCPCGFYGDPQPECSCSTLQVQRYRTRVSGPLLDRLDIQVEVPGVAFKDLASPKASEASAAIRMRVDAARQIQRERFRGRRIFCNAQMHARDFRRCCQIDGDGERMLEDAMRRFGLSARAYTRILKVARTIADLDGQGDIATGHLAEAIQYRSLDRSFR